MWGRFSQTDAGPFLPNRGGAVSTKQRWGSFTQTEVGYSRGTAMAPMPTPSSGTPHPSGVRAMFFHEPCVAVRGRGACLRPVRWNSAGAHVGRVPNPASQCAKGTRAECGVGVGGMGWRPAACGTMSQPVTGWGETLNLSGENERPLVRLRPRAVRVTPGRLVLEAMEQLAWSVEIVRGRFAMESRHNFQDTSKEMCTARQSDASRGSVGKWQTTGRRMLGNIANGVSPGGWVAPNQLIPRCCRAPLSRAGAPSRRLLCPYLPSRLPSPPMRCHRGTEARAGGGATARLPPLLLVPQILPAPPTPPPRLSTAHRHTSKTFRLPFPCAYTQGGFVAGFVDSAVELLLRGWGRSCFAPAASRLLCARGRPAGTQRARPLTQRMRFSVPLCTRARGARAPRAPRVELDVGVPCMHMQLHISQPG
eukprot:gene24004-biopygen23870